MQITTWAKTRNGFLAAFVALALVSPAFAGNLGDAPAPLDETVGDLPAPSTPDPSFAMAASSMSSDALSNFGPSSGTVVGNRSVELRDEVLRLRSSVNLNSNQFAILRSSGAAGAVQYHSTVAAITARLQNGTTRGNPILLRQWEEANASLDEVTSSLGRLNSLQVSIDADASLSSYLLGSVQAAFQLSGAVDEDYDQLKLLHDEISRMVVQLDYLRNQTTNDIQRQTNYLMTERANLQALAFAISRGELLGNSLANRPVIVNPTPVASMPSAPQAYSATQPPAPVAPAPMAAPPSQVFQSPTSAPMMQQPALITSSTTTSNMDLAPHEFSQAADNAAVTPASITPTGPVTSSSTAEANVTTPTIGHLLVLIRYNQPVVEYEQQLSRAVGSALERHPDAEFSIVAVAPASGDPADLAKDQQSAQSDAEAVKRSLIQLGLPPSHITMASTQTQNAQTPEVHVYVR